MSDTAKTDLVNKAMSHMGEPGFATVETDPPGAALAKVLGQLDGRFGAERLALAAHPWLCALTYASLSPSLDVPVNWKWSAAFVLPATFVRMWVVDGMDVPFEVGTAAVAGDTRPVVWANLGSLDVCFTEQKGFDAYSPQLGEYMALLLAAKTVGPLKSDYDAARRLAAQAADALAIAQGGEAGQYTEQAGDQVVYSNFAALRAQAG